MANTREVINTIGFVLFCIALLGTFWVFYFFRPPAVVVPQKYDIEMPSPDFDEPLEPPPSPEFKVFGPPKNFDCPICHVDFEEKDTTVQLNCGHHMHYDCAQLFAMKAKRRNYCPICRKKIEFEKLMAILYRSAWKKDKNKDKNAEHWAMISSLVDS